MKKFLLVVLGVMTFSLLNSAFALDYSGYNDDFEFFESLKTCQEYHSMTTFQRDDGATEGGYAKNIRGFNQNNECEISFNIWSSNRQTAANAFDADVCTVKKKNLPNINKTNFKDYCIEKNIK